MKTETTTTEPLTRADMRMIRTAFRQRWPVTGEKRQAIIRQLQQVADDPRRPECDRKRAVETLAIVNGAN